MKLLLLSGIAAIGFSASAHAQWVVSDPAVEIQTLMTQINTGMSYLKDVQLVTNTGRQIVQLGQTVNAVAHGNVYGVTDLIPELAGMMPATPIGDNGQQVANAFAGLTSGVGQIGGLAANFAGMTGFSVTGNDYRAMQIAAATRSAGAQMAFAGQMLNSGVERQSLLPQLFAALTGTPDVKAAVDASARVQQEEVRQSGHTNQLLAALVMQGGQRQMRDAQEQAAWRCSADNFVGAAQAAADAAGTGTVQLVSYGTAAPCNTPPSQAVSLASTQDDLPAGSPPQQAQVNLGANSGLDTPSAGLGGGMMQQAWGATAAANAQALGVNPDALSATCTIESNCQNVAGTGSVTGAFQMTAATQTAAQQEALAQNPGLSVSGDRSDPAVQSVAAAQYLKDAANSLQQAGVDSPTVLDTRGYYQFGPRLGATIALADPSQNMAQLLSGTYSASTLTANGIGPGTTVGQWRQSISNKIGDGANAPVLLA